MRSGAGTGSRALGWFELEQKRVAAGSLTQIASWEDGADIFEKEIKASQPPVNVIGSHAEISKWAHPGPALPSTIVDGLL